MWTEPGCNSVDLCTLPGMQLGKKTWDLSNEKKGDFSMDIILTWLLRKKSYISKYTQNVKRNYCTEVLTLCTLFGQRV